MLPMLIRASAKFQKQFPHELEFGIPASKPFPHTWNVEVLPNGRSQIIVLASEEQTLFPFLIATSRTRNLNTFLDAFRQRLLQFSKQIGIELFNSQEAPQFTFAKRTNRSIIGSQNDQLLMIWHMLQASGKPAPFEKLLEIERELHEMPMSYLAMACPLEALRRKVASRRDT